jgi:hypothetical protein
MPRRHHSTSWSSERRGAPGGAFLVLDEGRSNAAVALSLSSPTGVACVRRLICKLPRYVWPDVLCACSNF